MHKLGLKKRVYCVSVGELKNDVVRVTRLLARTSDLKGPTPRN